MGMLGWIAKLLEAFEMTAVKEAQERDDAEKRTAKEKIRTKIEFERKLDELNEQIKKLSKIAAAHWSEAKKYALSGMEEQKKQKLCAYQMLRSRIEQLNKCYTIASVKMADIESGALSSDIFKASGEYAKLVTGDIDAVEVTTSFSEVETAQREIHSIDQMINRSFEKESENASEMVDTAVSKELEALLDSEIAGELNVAAKPVSDNKQPAENKQTVESDSISKEVDSGLEELKKLMDNK